MTKVQRISNGLMCNGPKLTDALKIAKNNPKTYHIDAATSKKGLTTTIARFTENNRHVKLSMYDNKTGEIIHSAHTFNGFAIDKHPNNEFVIVHLRDPQKEPFKFKAEDFSDFVNWIKTMITAIRA